MPKPGSVWYFVTIIIASLVVLLVGFVAVRTIQQRGFQQEVMAALANNDHTSRTNSLAHLRDTRGPETLAVLVQELDDPDGKMHVRAGSALTLFYGQLGDAAPRLADRLQGSPYADVRLACAILLMPVKLPVVHAAYLRALRDSSDKVASIACTEVAAGAQKGDEAAVYAILDHPSWRVRLEVCKALIVMNKADNRVVSTLQEMSKDPEAARYDAEIEEFDRLDKEMGTAAEMGKRWGKLETILQRAQRIAGN